MPVKRDEPISFVIVLWNGLGVDDFKNTGEIKYVNLVILYSQIK